METKNTGAVASLGGYVPETTVEELIDKDLLVVFWPC